MTTSNSRPAVFSRLFWTALCTLLWCFPVSGGAIEPPWVDVPQSGWQGPVNEDVSGVDHPAAAVVALPASEAKPLQVSTSRDYAPGLYEVRLAVRASHTADAIAFNSGLKAQVGGADVADITGEFFARTNQPETRTFEFVHAAPGPIALTLNSYADPAVFQAAKPLPAAPDPDGPAAGAAPAASLTPETAVYFVIDAVQIRPLSHSGEVSNVTLDKIRYNPGDTLQGSVTLTDVGGKGGSGTVTLVLDHNLGEATKVKTIPVQLGPAAQVLNFEIPLPKEELGYALEAQYSSADGADHSSAAEYFTIAANFNRVAIFGASPGGTRDVTLDDGTIKTALSASRANYFNACEYPFWAEDDLLAMSPSTDYWFSGQANYHMNKATLQSQIRLAHEQGIAMVTYGKWCASGPQGWDTAYDDPVDFQGNYNHPIGMWGGVNAVTFDRRRNGEQVPYSPRPNGNGKGHWFDDWWNDFLGITPDATPANVRRAADETIRSIAMFGWDGIRWDGHPQGAGWAQSGRSGNYQAWASRQTQTLVHYFKDIVGAKYPNFQYGYNYFLVEPNKDYPWAVEDYELDELARGGGLLMNESIGNASQGWTFDSIGRNLQVEGDLARERGGYYLGISYASSPRDKAVESALWAAAGCRPYNSGMTREVRRYCTRYAQYTFDENLRRLATPEKVLAPQSPTTLWWQPFVYETPIANGRRQLVVNLLNIPRQATRPGKPNDGTMPPGTDPVNFALTLPAGLKATGASLIDPQTLDVTPLPLQNGVLQVPAVASWSVAVIDLSAADGAPSLASLYGPPKTFGQKRPDVTDDKRLPEVILDLKQDDATAAKAMAPLQPPWVVQAQADQATFDALPAADQPAALLKIRAGYTPDAFDGTWWKGGALPDDLKLKDAPPVTGDLTPHRDDSFKIYYARGAMDYRLRMPEAFAGLPRVQVQDAPFWGGFRGGSGGMGMDGTNWRQYPNYDLLLFTGIPHPAIGAENSYGLVDYVKAGGSALFTGGEYAFGKGGYMFTVLERELLPVLCTEMQDARTLDQPAAMEPGKDFSDLNYHADFTAKPSFWVYNRVVLKDDPGVKVFLTSSKGPILVGWQLGKGRVACLLVDYRGKSGDGTTAFFDWADWPGLARAVFHWLAPDAGSGTAVPAPAAASLDQATNGLGLPANNPDAPGTTDPTGASYADALSLALLKTPDRVDEGKAKVAAWNASEKQVLDQWTGGKGFSPAAPELPGLDADSLFQRVAWLDYLSRFDAADYGAPFARQWLMLDQYQDYSWRSLGNKRAGDWKRMAACLGRLRDLTRPDLMALAQSNPDGLAAGFAQAHFTSEYWEAINVLGALDRKASVKILTRLKTASNPDLAAFATARLASVSG